MKRLEIAQYIALGATCMTVLGFVINLATQSRWSMTMCGYGVMIGLISYFFGGIKTAVNHCDCNTINRLQNGAGSFCRFLMIL